MKVEELKRKLELHPKWLRDEEGGERFVAICADLRHADLRHADLRGADLRGADLEDADLPDNLIVISGKYIIQIMPDYIRIGCKSITEPTDELFTLDRDAAQKAFCEISASEWEWWMKKRKIVKVIWTTLKERENESM